MKKTYITLTASLSVISFLGAQDKPNILWMTFEDTSPQFIGCYGNSAAKTPNMDALANGQNGLRFNYAYSNSTVSSASRSCIITGMDVNRLGTGNHRFNRAVPSWAKGFPYHLRQAGYYASNNVKTDYNISNAGFINESWNESSETAHWRKRPNANTPFFSVFNIMYSHQSYVTAQSHKYYMDNVFNIMANQYKSSPDDMEIPPFFYQDDEMREYMGRIQNCVNYTDQVIGERLAELRADGLDDNTIIFIFADHGEGMPRAKTCALGLGYRVPFIVWFPDKWKSLNPFNQHVVDDTQICFEDLAPTILNLAGIEIPGRMAGKPFLGTNLSGSQTYIHGSRNRIDETPGLERSVMKDKFVYTRVFSPYLPTVKNEGYHYNSDILRSTRKHQFYNELNVIQQEPFQPRAIEYLYNLENDPWEINNLATDPAYHTLLQELRNEMVRYALEIKDIGFMPEYEMANRAVGSTPYAIRESNYNIEKVLQTAMLVGGGNAVLPEQLNLLTDADPVVRYWAAAGIYNQGENAVANKTAIQAALNNEVFAAAKIELAAFLYKYCNDESGAGIIKNYANNTNPLIATTALLKIQEFGDKITEFKDFVTSVKTYWNTNDNTYTASPAANVTQILIEEKLLSPISDRPVNQEYYYIRNTVTGGYLAVANSAALNSKTIQTLVPDSNAEWQLTEVDHAFYLKTKNGLYALEIPNGVTTNGIAAETRNVTASNTQQWELRPFQYGYKIYNEQTSNALQVNGQSKNQNATVTQWQWNGSPHFVWKLESRNTLETDVPSPVINKSKLIDVYPNPLCAGEKLHVRFTLFEPSSYEICLRDLSGKTIIKENRPLLIPGEYVVNFDLLNVPAGSYLMSLQTPGSILNQHSQLLLIR